MTTGDPLAVAANAARGFLVLQCQECARNIRDALRAAGYGGEMIEIRGVARRDFMICLSYDGGRSTITQNGKRIGVRVRDTVFDNPHPDGLPVEQWLKDFDAIGGIEIVSTTAF